MKTDSNRAIGRYFQFPVCALAFGENEDERLNTILDYAVVEAGSTIWRKMLQDERQRLWNQWTRPGDAPKDIDLNNKTHLAAMAGAETIGITYHNFSGLITRHAAMKKFHTAFVARHEKDATVRIRKDWLFKARDRRGLTYREFMVLTAIYSVIGNKDEPVLITQDVIRARALGYKTAAVMAVELSLRKDGQTPLTDWQLRDTIARLHRNKFFARATYGRRLTYYSNRLSQDELRQRIVERKAYAPLFQHLQASQDAAMTTSVRKARASATPVNSPAPQIWSPARSLISRQ